MHNRLLVVFCFVAVSGLVDADEDLLGSVAQVRVTRYEVEFENPWQKGSGDQYSASAVLIDEDRLITNAHVVSQALRIDVRRGDSNRWYKAVIENVSDASDLALLVVEDKSFYKGSKSVDIGTDVALGSKMTVVGFPIGGDSVSITEGILSRTEVTTYAHSGIENLTYQLDAAINSGNSGGPVFHNGKLVAISSQSLEEANNIGYAIPVPVINQFIADVKDGKVDGVPILPFSTQAVFNPTQRAFYSMGSRSGLRVTQSAGPEDKRCLADGDVILSVDGLPIGPDGMIRDGTLGSVPIDYFASSKQVGDSLDFELVAKDKNRSVSCELNWTWNDVFTIAPTTYNYRPVWAQVGGIVLLEMTQELFEFLLTEEAVLQEGVTDTQVQLQQGTPQDPRRYLFVVNVLQHDLNEGYDVTGLLINTVNGIALRNIEHLQQLLDSNSLPWLELGFNSGESVVFKAADLSALNEQLAQEYGF